MTPARWLARTLLPALAVAVSPTACSKSDAPEAARVSLRLASSAVSVMVGETVDLQLAAALPAEAGPRLRWRSADTTIARVDSVTGQVLGTNPGATRVFAVVDSVRTSAIVSVTAPPLAFAVDPTSLLFDAVGADAPLALVRTGGVELPDTSLLEICTSDDSTVAALIDGPSIQSRGEGRATIRCQIGTAADSMIVRVAQRPVRVFIPRTNIRPVAMQDDSLSLRIASVDRLGTPITGRQTRWRSLDPRIVQMNEITGVATPVSQGVGRVVGFLEGLADTASVEVVDMVANARDGLPPAVVALSGEALGGEYGIDDPELDLVDEVLPLGVEAPPVLPPQDQLIQEVVIGPPGADTVFRSTFGIRISAVGAFGDHRLDLGLGTERTSGPLFGAELSVLLSRRLEFTFRGMGGTLSASDALVEDRQVIAVEGTARYAALDFFDIEIGAGLRKFDTQLASQTWGWASAGIGLRGEALDGALRGRIGFALLPLINVTEQASPDFGLIGSAELEYRFGHFWVGVHYALSRYEFPDVAGIARVEQYSEIRLSLGWFLGNF